MLVHRRVTRRIKFAGTHLYTQLERGNMRLKCLAQEHNTMSLAESQTQTACSGVERTNLDATALLNGAIKQFCHIILLIMVIIKKIGCKPSCFSIVLKLHILFQLQRTKHFTILYTTSTRAKSYLYDAEV